MSAGAAVGNGQPKALQREAEARLVSAARHFSAAVADDSSNSKLAEMAGRLDSILQEYVGQSAGGPLGL